MKKLLVSAFLTLATFVFSTYLAGSVEAAEIDAQYFVRPSCSVSFGDTYCAQNPEHCKEALAPTKTPEHSFSKMEYSSSYEVSDEIQIDAEEVFAIVNRYRADAGLPPFQKDDNLCQIAASRGPELHHEVLVSGDLHGGLRARNLPYWVTENMKYGTSAEEVVQWWLNSPLHRSAVYGNHTYSCGTCVGRACAQLFTSYIPK